MSFETKFSDTNAAEPATFDLASVAGPSWHERRRLQVVCFALSAPLSILGALVGYVLITAGPSVALKIALLALSAACFVTTALLVSLAMRFTGLIPSQLSLDSTGFILTYGNGKSRVLKWDASMPVAEMTDARLMPGIRPHNAFSMRPKRSPEIALTKDAYEAFLSAARSHAAVLSERTIRIWSGKVIRTVLRGQEYQSGIS